MNDPATPRRKVLIHRPQGIHTQAPAVLPYHLDKSPTLSRLPQRPLFAHKTSFPNPQHKTPETLIDLAEAIATAPARVPAHTRMRDPDEDAREAEHRHRVMTAEEHVNNLQSHPIAGKKRPRPEALVGGGGAVDRTGRASKRAKLEEREERARNEERFKEKYTKAFPAFKFYFDSLDSSVRSSLASRVQQLGARIEDFFSSSVTHFITNKSVPSPEHVASLDNKENAPTGSTTHTLNSIPRPAGGRTNANFPLQSPIQLRPPANKYDPLVSKAVHFNMKIWDEKKLDNMLVRLLPHIGGVHYPSKVRADSQVAPASQPTTLSHLLQAERHSGLTHERDPTVLRRDYKYFGKNSYFVLVEDREGIHAPIAVKEYGKWKPQSSGIVAKPSKAASGTRRARRFVDEEEEMEEEHDDVFFGSAGVATGPVEKDTGGLDVDDTPWPPLRDHVGKAKPTWAEGKLGEKDEEEDDEDIQLVHRGNDEQPEEEEDVDVPHHRASKLRRTASMHDIGRPLLGPGTHDEQSDYTPSFLHPKPSSGIHFLPGARPMDRDYVAASGNSVVITSHINSTTSYSISNAHQQQHQQAAAAAAPLVGGKRLHQQVLTHRTFTRAAAAEDTDKEKEERPRVLRKSKSTNTLKVKKTQVRLPRREEAKKPGYCENCRLRFDDFNTHISTKKHLKFARNDDNFWSLDEILARLERQPIVEVARAERIWYEEGARMILGGTPSDDAEGEEMLMRHDQLDEGERLFAPRSEMSPGEPMDEDDY